MINMFHTDYLNIFNRELYKGVLTPDNLISDEICIKYNDNEYFGFILAKDDNKRKVKQKYFLPTQIIDKLPLKVTSKKKFSYKANAYWFIGSATSIKIPTEKKMEFRKLVDNFADYAHSNEKHWKLFRMVALGAYFERMNIRVVSEASFGKDGVVDILQLLNGSVANLYKATLAKLKYSLRNDYVVINELGALNSQQVADMQTYLLQAGAYKPIYENNSRSVAGTKESMDLMTKSHLIFHNTPYYYEEKGQAYFERMFTKAVMDRFPALLFDGYVTEDFTTAPNKSDFNEKDSQKIKDIISTINYFKENHAFEAKFELKEDYFGFKDREKQRSLRSFKIICKYLDLYSKDEEEFQEWIKVLKECYDKYKNIVTLH